MKPVEVPPADPHARDEVQAVLERFGPRTTGASGTACVQLERGAEMLTQLVRALDEQGLGLRNLELHQPSLDDVFLAKTGRKLDVGTAEEPEGLAV